MKNLILWACRKLVGKNYAIVPVKPSDGLLMSMAIRNDHGLGLYIHKEEAVQSAMRTMRQLHEEVVGTGFYQYQNEKRYQNWYKQMKGEKK